MILLDVNVILAAHRIDHAHHSIVEPWFRRLVAQGESFTVPDGVWASFVRISTNHRIFEEPTPADEAFAFLRAVRAQPGHASTVPGERHLEIFEHVCRTYEVRGERVPDAYLAALAIEQGAAVASLDRDFARIDELRWIRPS